MEPGCPSAPPPRVVINVVPNSAEFLAFPPNRTARASRRRGSLRGPRVSPAGTSCRLCPGCAPGLSQTTRSRPIPGPLSGSLPGLLSTARSRPPLPAPLQARAKPLGLGVKAKVLTEPPPRPVSPLRPAALIPWQDWRPEA